MGTEMHEIAPGILAFIHPEGRSNCGMIRTREGVVLIDTAGRPQDIQECLDMANVTPRDIRMVLITHSHSDHTSGIPFFDCPIIAHKAALQRIKSRNTDRAKTRLPTEIFDDRRDLDVGGVKLEMIHFGGHTPCSSVVWLPDQKVLFSGDLIFQGRYPFLATADVQKLMDALSSLLSFEARVIVPGHGVLCDNGEVQKQLEYIQTTWKLTEEHLARGYGLDVALKDPQYPIYSKRGYEKLHPWNIKIAYQQARKKLEREGGKK